MGRGNGKRTELHCVDDEQGGNAVLVGCVGLEDNDSNNTENVRTVGTCIEEKQGCFHSLHSLISVSFLQKCGHSMLPER